MSRRHLHDLSCRSNRVACAILVSLFAMALSMAAGAQTISTFAGGGVGDGGPLRQAFLNGPQGTEEAQGVLYIADTDNHRVRKRLPDGTLVTVAGTGVMGYLGDGGSATSAQLNRPIDVAVDAAGNVYIADAGTRRIRKVSTTGIISTVAGGGAAPHYCGGTVATSSSLGELGGIAVDAAGNLVIAIPEWNRVCLRTASGYLNLRAGSGTAGYSGDGSHAMAATLNYPTDVALDAAGNLYIADSYNSVVRKVTPGNIISTVAGGGDSEAEGIAATSADLDEPRSVDVGTDGRLFIVDASKHRVRAVDGSGIIRTIAGNGLNAPISGDGGPAVNATLGSSPEDVTAADDGSVLLASLHGVIRRVQVDGIIDTYIGGGVGDGVDPDQARLDLPGAIAIDATGNVYVHAGNRIRRFTPAGVSSTIAGNGVAGFSGDGGSATSASIGVVGGMAAGADGSIYFTDTAAHRIRKISPTGIITTIAGSGAQANTGNTGPAIAASLHTPTGLAMDAGGNLYVSTQYQIRRISPDGTITAFVGTGLYGIAGEGVLATATSLSEPAALAIGNDGLLYFMDRGQNRVYRVTSDGTIQTLAGNGGNRDNDLGVPALSGGLSDVRGIAVDSQGQLYISQGSYSHRVLRVTHGVLLEFAGQFGAGFVGDGGAAALARLNGPRGIAVAPDGRVYIADSGNGRVRRVETVRPATVPSAPPAPVAVAGDGSATLTLQAPADDGGAPITGYVIEPSPSIAGSGGQTSSLALTQTFHGLVNGTSYTFTVRAINALGSSLPSAPSNAVTPQGLPQLTGASVRTAEGNSGTTPVVVTFSLSAASATPVSFGVRTSDATANAGSDYQSLVLSGVTIPAGQTSVAVTLQVLGDTVREGEETFHVSIQNLVGARIGKNGFVTIVDDDSAFTFGLRDDRHVLGSSDERVVLDVLANDYAEAALLAGGTLQILEAPVHGVAEVTDPGTPGTVADDRISFRPAFPFHGEDVFTYRLCLSDGKCREALVSVVVRPAKDVEIYTDSRSGSLEVEVGRLRSLPSARFLATRLVAPVVVEGDVSADASIDFPWDSSAGRFSTLRTIPAPADGQARQWNLLVDTRVGLLDLYLGLDRNGDGLPSADEVACTSAMTDGYERCELSLAQAGDQALSYWVVAHNESRYARKALLHIYEVPMSPTDGSLVATGPGLTEGAEGLSIRVGWQDGSLLVDEARVGYVRVMADTNTPAGSFPVRVDRYSGNDESRMLVSGVDHPLRLGASSPPRIFVDVPVGATRLTLSGRSDRDVDLYMDRLADPIDPLNSTIAPAPGYWTMRYSDTGDSLDKTLVVEGAQLQPGRWMITPRFSVTHATHLTLRATVEGSAPLVRPGSYFNAGRSGHGVFLYPAGKELAGLWYTYLPDGTSTWYYLQGPTPGANGVWTTPVYRSAWDGSRNSLTTIGQAVVTPMGPDNFTFSYSVDGRTGSEPMTGLGRGCPMLGGLPQDLSSHWFNPARAGTGYSVQMWPNYEYYAAFVYDRQGIARFLTAERNGFGGTDATLDLEQLTGFCPTCERAGAPARTRIGTFRRLVSGGAITRIELDGIYTGGVPGVWAGQEAVQALGGPGTTQGCQP